jgi:hypothetical protein
MNANGWIIGGLAAIAISSGADAAQRTFVAVSGSDSNACSVGAPCRSFATALTHTDPAGEVIVLESGGYGRVTITQSVSIEAPQGIYGGISVFGGTNGIDVNAPGGTVKLRGLAINGQGGDVGINVTAVGALRIERCRVSEMAQHGLLINAAGAVVTVSELESSGNADNGIEANGVLDIAIVRSIVARNVHGIRLTAGVRAEIGDTLVHANSQVGVYGTAGPTATPTKLRLDRMEVAQNGGTGVAIVGVASGLGTLVVARSSIHDNGGNGVFGNASPGPVDVAVTDSVVSGHPIGPAVTILSAGAKLVATRNAVVDNGYLGFNNASGLFESTGDNVVRNNNGGGAQTAGTITAIGGT